MKINRQYFFYILFAVCSTALNFFVQKICEVIFYSFNNTFFSFQLYKNIDIATLLKLSAATAAAFIFKYTADRFLVFKKGKYATAKKEIARIGLYTLFSIFTTFLFWAVQLLFKIYFQLEYLGLILGLAAGYTIKFFLDKHVVFSH
ncbi:MAG: GtrA family protein [Spirochaetales bacterium]|nr:GtrA family protein [Spirochaetales bacterium]